MIFPKIEEIKETNNKSGSIDFVFNAETGQHNINNGNLIECDERQALKQWIRKTILTELGVYEIYTRDEVENYGVKIHSQIGTKNKGYWQSELQREIEEQLSKHHNIREVTNYKVDYKDRTIRIKFTVITKNLGPVEMEVSKYA